MKFKLAMVAAALWFAVLPAGRILAQDASGSVPMLRLYIDPKTKIVYAEPGRGRQLLTEIPATALGAKSFEQRQEKTEADVQQTQQQMKELMDRNRQLEVSNTALTQQVNEIVPSWRSYIENFQNKFQIGTLFYGDYRYYTHAGWQPQELTQITNLGQGNNNYNSFDVTRTYLNVFFFPTDDWTLRLTPNMYKTIGSSNIKVGQSTGFGSNLDGDLGVRMKYAFLQYNSLWDKLVVPALKGGTFRFGEAPNPLVDWEEQLYGYRYVNLTPWNYLSLSSTQVGMSMQGPIKPFNDGLTYVDYDFGVFDNSSFHAFEQTDTKQVMGRVSVYPFGAGWRFQGLGITGFYNYGYGNTAPDTAGLPTALKGSDAHIERIAALIHYSAEEWNLAAELDYGKNAFSMSNLFSGSGPADAFGTATGKQFTSVTGKATQWYKSGACSSSPTCYNPYSGFGAQTGVWQYILNTGAARQVGIDFFGHYHIPGTRLTPFGMFEWFMPNDKVPSDPLDFQRFIVGVNYQYNEYLRFALDSQNVMFYHNQMSLPVTTLKSQYNYVPGAKLNSILLPQQGSIPFLVPRDTHSIFLNVEFNY
ncbi:MAG: hypothetical protein ABSD31_12800 [Candidatus Binataceae bacterium]|jgi:hypothetical protein